METEAANRFALPGRSEESGHQPAGACCRASASLDPRAQAPPGSARKALLLAATWAGIIGSPSTQPTPRSQRSFMQVAEPQPQPPHDLRGPHGGPRPGPPLGRARSVGLGSEQKLVGNAPAVCPSLTWEQRHLSHPCPPAAPVPRFLPWVLSQPVAGLCSIYVSCRPSLFPLTD